MRSGIRMRASRSRPASLFELARFMGTSAEQIDRCYGHQLPDSIDRTRTALNTFLAAQEQARSERLGT
jgi:hypothetical protein